MEDKTILSLVAILCLTVLEIAAMLTGLDGYIFGVIIAAIAAISGYEIRDLIKKPETPTPTPT